MGVKDTNADADRYDSAARGNARDVSFEPADLLTLEPVIGLALADVDENLREDLQQEVYVRLLAAGNRLDRSTLDAYAFVVARNAARSHDRRQAAYARATARLHPPVDEPGPEERDIIEEAPRCAMRSAWHELNEKDRAVLRARDIERRSAHDVASQLRIKPGAVRIRTMRARARLRVRFVVARRGLQLPTSRCRPVLDSLATGDRRRQRQLDASEHLLDCPTCSGLVEDVCERHRNPVWWLWLGATAAAAWLVRAVRGSPSITAGATVAAAMTVVAVVAVSSAGHHSVPRAAPPAPVSPPVAPATSESLAMVLPLMVNGAPFRPTATDLSGLAGGVVTGTGVTVLEVVGDEAFWVGNSMDERLLVVIETVESPQQVRPGQRATFSGVLVQHVDDFGPSVGVAAGEGDHLLGQQGVHAEIDAASLVIQ